MILFWSGQIFLLLLAIFLTSMLIFPLTAEIEFVFQRTKKQSRFSLTWLKDTLGWHLTIGSSSVKMAYALATQMMEEEEEDIEWTWDLFSQVTEVLKEPSKKVLWQLFHTSKTMRQNWDLEIGTGNPAKTGMVYGIFQAINAFTAPQTFFNIKPNFLETVYYGRINIRLQAKMYLIIWTGIHLLWHFKIAEGIIKKHIEIENQKSISSEDIK